MMTMDDVIVESDEVIGGHEATGWPWSANEHVAIKAIVCLPSPTFRFTGQQLLLPGEGQRQNRNLHLKYIIIRCTVLASFVKLAMNLDTRQCGLPYFTLLMLN